jgi:hypothetical protein
VLTRPDHQRAVRGGWSVPTQYVTQHVGAEAAHLQDAVCRSVALAPTSLGSHAVKALFKPSSLIINSLMMNF